MNKRKLTIEEVQRLVSQNCYQVDKKHWFLSRCIDGRYVGNELEPLAKPGADIGDLLMVFAANLEYGLEIESEKIFKAVLETVGGFKNFRFHTDEHHLNVKCQRSNVKSFLGCGHFKQASQDPSAYSLIEEEIKAVNKFLKEAEKKGAKRDVLQGEHLEGAVLMVNGDNWSIAPQIIINNELLGVFVYHKTLDDKRRKILVKHLLPYVKAPFSVEEEYLYEIMSQVADSHFLETVSRLAKDLPVYEVGFEEGGGFEIKEL